MPTYDTITQIKKHLTTVTALEIAETIDNIGVDTLNKVVYDEVYKDTDKFSDQPYVHTYGMKDKAEAYYSKSSPKVISLFLNILEKYPSFYKGRADNSDNIVNWTENGHGGYFMGQKVKYSGRNMFEKTAKKLLQGRFLRNEVVNKLKLLGYDISRTPSAGGDD